MTDDELRALQEQAHMLEELTRHPGWPVFVDYLQHIRAADMRRVINGFIDDQMVYKQATGKLSGIQAALDAPVTVRAMVDRELQSRAEREG